MKSRLWWGSRALETAVLSERLGTAEGKRRERWNWRPETGFRVGSQRSVSSRETLTKSGTSIDEGSIKLVLPPHTSTLLDNPLIFLNSMKIKLQFDWKLGLFRRMLPFDFKFGGEFLTRWTWHCRRSMGRRTGIRLPFDSSQSVN